MGHDDVTNESGIYRSDEMDVEQRLSALEARNRELEAQLAPRQDTGLPNVTRRQALGGLLGGGALLGATGTVSAESPVDNSASVENTDGSVRPQSSDQGPWYDHDVHTTTELKDAAVPASGIEVVHPDGTETVVVGHRDGTQSHYYDGSAYITFEQSRDGGQSFTTIGTINQSASIDPSRTGNGLIAVDDTTLYYFDSQVDYRVASGEATAVHELSWNASTKEWDVTTNLNRYENFRVMPHFVENGTINVGYVDFTASPSVVRFAEYEPATRQLTTLGTINGQPIRPNEHLVQPRKDGTLVAIVRCEETGISGTSPPAEQWSTSDDGGRTWTNHGFIEQTLHPSHDTYGAVNGGRMIDTPYGQRLIFLYRWILGDSDNHQTTLGVFNPFSGTVEQNIVVSTVYSKDGSNGAMRLVDDGPFGWQFYVVHVQGMLDQTGRGAGIFFRDLTLFQPATYLDRYLGGNSGGDEDTMPRPTDPAAASRRENTWLSISKPGHEVGGRAYLGSEQDIPVDTTEQIQVDTAEFADGITFDQENNAFVVQEDGIYDINGAISYIQTVPNDLIQSRVHLADDVGRIGPSNKTANGYFVTAKDVPLGIAGSVVTTTEKLSAGNAISLFGQYAGDDSTTGDDNSEKNPPTDPDGDGDFEDLTGDGEVTRADLEAYAERMDDPSFRAKVEKFDYNENGRIDHADLVSLFSEIN